MHGKLSVRVGDRRGPVDRYLRPDHGVRRRQPASLLHRGGIGWRLSRWPRGGSWMRRELFVRRWGARRAIVWDLSSASRGNLLRRRRPAGLLRSHLGGSQLRRRSGRSSWLRRELSVRRRQSPPTPILRHLPPSATVRPRGAASLLSGGARCLLRCRADRDPWMQRRLLLWGEPDGRGRRRRLGNRFGHVRERPGRPHVRAGSRHVRAGLCQRVQLPRLRRPAYAPLCGHRPRRRHPCRQALSQGRHHVLPRGLRHRKPIKADRADTTGRHRLR